MSKFRHEKNWFYWLSTIKNFMDCKSPRRSQKPATENERWEWVRFTLSFTLWRKRGWSIPVGETKAERRGEEQGDATIVLLDVARRSCKLYSLFAQIYSVGNQFREVGDVKELDDNARRAKVLELLERKKAMESLATRLSSAIEGSNQEFFEPETSKPEELKARLKAVIDEYAVVNSTLNEVKKKESLLESHKHPSPAETETWSIRWAAPSIAFLLDKRQREEWLGDLVETEREMLQAGRFPRWWINVIVLVRVASMLRSLLEIKQADSHNAEKRRIE